MSWHSLSFWESRIDECDSRLKSEDWNSIPSLNWTPLHDLSHQQLVRFRGMIQDMFDPEYFLNTYEKVDKNTGLSSVHSGKYKDSITYEPHETFITESSHNAYAERHTYYCVTIPAINFWVSDCEKKQCITDVQHQASVSLNESVKRELVDDDDASTSAESGGAKRVCVNAVESTTSSSVSAPVTPDLNFPITSQEGVACLLKVYDSEEILLNDVVEVVGFLSLEPALESNDAQSEMDVDTFMDQQHPPSSLVPRLHCVATRKIPHCNPLVKAPPMLSDPVFEMADSVRRDLHLVLSQLLLGDTLAAEYLLCHLLSYVFQRSDMLPLGKLSLNISNIPLNCDFVNYLYDIISLMVPKSHYLAMSLDNLNGKAFVPSKDYTTNKLKSGILQLSANTHLVLDETQLMSGQLDSTGIANVAALKTIISQQKVDYDFKYYRREFLTDVPVLVFSEGKSLLSSDAEVPLCPDQEHTTEVYEAAKHFLQKDNLLDKIRVYLTVMRHASYEVPSSMEQSIQENFVELRKENRANTTADDLHLLLVIARLLTLSRGKNTLDEWSWKRALAMEQERKQRIASKQQRT